MISLHILSSYNNATQFFSRESGLIFIFLKKIYYITNIIIFIYEVEDIINKYNKEFNFIDMVVNDFEKYLIDVKTNYFKMISKGIVIQNFED